MISAAGEALPARSSIGRSSQRAAVVQHRMDWSWQRRVSGSPNYHRTVRLWHVAAPCVAAEAASGGIRPPRSSRIARRDGGTARHPSGLAVARTFLSTPEANGVHRPRIQPTFSDPHRPQRECARPSSRRRVTDSPSGSGGRSDLIRERAAGRRSSATPPRARTARPTRSSDLIANSCRDASSNAAAAWSDAQAIAAFNLSR